MNNKTTKKRRVRKTTEAEAPSKVPARNLARSIVWSRLESLLSQPVEEIEGLGGPGQKRRATLQLYKAVKKVGKAWGHEVIIPEELTKPLPRPQKKVRAEGEEKAAPQKFRYVKGEKVPAIRAEDLSAGMLIVRAGGTAEVIGVEPVDKMVVTLVLRDPTTGHEYRNKALKSATFAASFPEQQVANG